MSQQTDSKNTEPAVIKVSNETTERVLQNFRNRIEELTLQNARMRFTLEAIKSSAQRELRRKPIE